MFVKKMLKSKQKQQQQKPLTFKSAPKFISQDHSVLLTCLCLCMFPVRV